jgi:copper chaperone
MEKVILQVDGMTCGSCATSIRKVLMDLEGVRSVEVDLHNGKVTIERGAGQPTNEELVEAVEDAGYDVIG